MIPIVFGGRLLLLVLQLLDDDIVGCSDNKELAISSPL
jgi:hypothetical protein